MNGPSKTIRGQLAFGAQEERSTGGDRGPNRLARETTAAGRSDDGQWCCVQAGHREQYGVPRALQSVGALQSLITDLWIPPDSAAAALARGAFGRRLRDRFHQDIETKKVASFPLQSFLWEARTAMQGKRAGSRTLARNAWWSSLAARRLRRGAGLPPRYVFSYCYEARELFKTARSLGIIPILGQIDPGPVEDAKVAEICAKWSSYVTSFMPGSAEYYGAWRDECRLAGSIIVNSEWSKSALIRAGIESEKINVVPLVYTPPPESYRWRRYFSEQFTNRRPLRVLFLGQCILRKGIAETIEAAKALSDEPVEFTLVGNTDIDGLERHFGRGRIRHFQRVSRGECHAHYRNADIFLFPTHSDGYGLTQLEAQSWRLPILVSGFCGKVIEDGRDGLLLDTPSVDAIVQAVRLVISKPSMLARMSASIPRRAFNIEDLGQRLKNLAAATEARR